MYLSFLINFYRLFGDMVPLVQLSFRIWNSWLSDACSERTCCNWL